MENFKIGFIGLGTMGEPMCTNILTKLKQPVNIFDINPIQMQKLSKIGALKCDTIKQVGEISNLIFLMVPNSEHVKSVIEELITTIQPGTIICDMSSISPVVEKECAKKIINVKGIPVEAPVVKSKGAAISGTLGILAAGDEDAIMRIKPILLLMGEEVVYYGDSGNGMTMKILHNMLVGNIQNAVNEMFVMGEAAGLDPTLITQGCRIGGGQNFYLDSKCDSIKNRDFSPKFSVRNMAKDTRLHEELAKNLMLELPGSNLIRSIYNEAENQFPDEDFSATFKIVQKRSHT